LNIPDEALDGGNVVVPSSNEVLVVAGARNLSIEHVILPHELQPPPGTVVISQSAIPEVREAFVCY
jgi:hypothetical protein